MKRILVVAAAGAFGAAGALGAAGLITATPASALPAAGCTPEILCELVDQPATFVNGIATSPQQFQQNLQSQPGTFADSINPANQINQFLNGDCTDFDAGVCEEDQHVGLLNQPEQFVRNLASQPQTFADSINPANQLQTFSDSIADPFNAVEAGEEDD